MCKTQARPMQACNACFAHTQLHNSPTILTQDYLDQVQNRTKEKRYTFDVAFGTEVSVHVYEGEEP